MNIVTGILLTIVALILIVFVSYLLWDHSKKAIDTRPDDIENLAKENGWVYSAKSQKLDQLIEKNSLGYMGSNVTIKNVCIQEQSKQTVYIFDAMVDTPMSGIAFEFDALDLPRMNVVEKLIKNRLTQPLGEQIEAERLPKFVKAKVLVYASADEHDQICTLIAENDDLQALLKQRDLGYFCLQANCVVFYFLTRYPAEQRDFGKVIKRAELISQLFGN